MARTCRIGPDNKLYITLGQPFIVPPPEKLDNFKKWGIGNIIRMDRDGKNREVYAWGIRKSVGMDFNPKDKTLWFTDNRVDGMGRIFRRASSTARTSPVRISASRTTAGSRGNIRAPSSRRSTAPGTVPFRSALA